MAILQNKPVFIPIYRRLFEDYRDAMLTHRLNPGDRIDSINKIIELHQVSRETAKTVLNMLEREGLIIQRAGKGSFVADLAPPRRIWAVVLPYYSVQYEDLISRLSQKAWAAGRQFHHFVDYNNYDEEIHLVGRLITERYEAVIVVPTLDESKTSDFYARLPTQGSVVVLLDHTMTGSWFAYVIQSYDLGVQRAIDHLLGRCATGIAFVRNDIWAGRNLVQEMMEETFKEVMAEKRPGREPLVVDHAGRVDAAFVRANDVGGIFCCDDSDAVRVIGSLKEQGVRVPGDMSLVSYGNTRLAHYFTPSITSIDPHNQEMAATVSNIVMAKLQGQSTAFSQYVVQPELVERET